MIFIVIAVIAMVVAFVALGLERDKYDEFTWKFKGKCLASVLCLAIGVLGCFASVPTGHTGVVTTFGKVEDFTLEAGIHIINPLSRVIDIDNRTQKATVSMSAFSSDIQEVNVVYTVNYCIDKTNAQNLYKNIGLSYFETVIQPKVIENVKRVMAKYTAENLVSARAEVAVAIENGLVSDLKKYNIEVVATSIEDLDFTDAFTDAVEAKQVAEQNKLKAETEAETQIIKAQADADMRLIEARAAAEANELLTESLTPDILRKQAIEKWDGHLPKVMPEGSSLFDLTGLMD